MDTTIAELPKPCQASSSALATRAQDDPSSLVLQGNQVGFSRVGPNQLKFYPSDFEANLDDQRTLINAYLHLSTRVDIYKYLTQCIQIYFA